MNRDKPTYKCFCFGATTAMTKTIYKKIQHSFGAVNADEDDSPRIRRKFSVFFKNNSEIKSKQDVDVDTLAKSI